MSCALAAGEGGAQVALGERLFHDARLSSPSGDMSASCASCHMASDPQGDRAFTELLAKSWHPWRNEDPGRDTLRNTPTLIDVGLMPRLHYDGEFASLEQQVEETVVGRNFGWLPGEREAALRHVRAVIAEDATYPDAFDAAFDAQPADVDAETLLARIGASVAAFMRTLRSEHDSLYDAFMALNDLPAAPLEGESPKAYAARVMAGLDELEAQGKLARPSGFGHDAYLGLKTFFRTRGDTSVGNCVTCHVPPHFSDFAFHNTGMSQDEYDAVHGSDSFSALNIAADAAGEKRFRSIVDARAPGQTDLGRWNFNAREETIAAFKTPTLRHLASTAPYGHSGYYPTIEHVIEQKMVAAFRYRMGRLRHGDPEMAAIRITEADIGPLFDFLNTLNSEDGRKARRTRLGPAADAGATSYYRSPGDRREY